MHPCGLLQCMTSACAVRQWALAAWHQVFNGGAQVSCDAYRAVVRGDARFIDYFQAATPVSELARMNIGSRPAKRKAAGSIDTLRAIPWIFAWTQTRFHLPVWLGIGAAFQASHRRQCLGHTLVLQELL